MSIGEKLMKDPRYAAQIEAQCGKDHARDVKKMVNGGFGRRAATRTKDSTGWIHPSKLQAGVTDRLRLDAAAVIPEVSIPLSQRPRDRIRLDCLVIKEVHEDGTFTGYFADPKGHLEEKWKQKARRFADLYGTPILLIKK
jgi:hypothetical protein